MELALAVNLRQLLLSRNFLLCLLVKKIGYHLYCTRLANNSMVNFGLLTGEICWRVWGTPANFNGFRVLAALLHGTVVVDVSQTVALNRGCHLYLAGRPSRWVLAHILVFF